MIDLGRVVRGLESRNARAECQVRVQFFSIAIECSWGEEMWARIGTKEVKCELVQELLLSTELLWSNNICYGL